MRILALKDIEMSDIQAGDIIEVPDDDLILFSVIPMIFLYKSDPGGIAAIAEYKQETIDTLEKFKDIVILTDAEGNHILGGFDFMHMNVVTTRGQMEMRDFLKICPQTNNEFLDSIFAQFMINCMHEDHRFLFINKGEKNVHIEGYPSFCFGKVDDDIPLDKLEAYIYELTLPF